MTKLRCDWTEEEIIDCLLGYKSSETQLRLQLHCQSCARCNDLFHDWANVLENQAEQRVEPSFGLKVRMGCSLFLQRLRMSFRTRRRMLLAAASGMLFFALFSSLFIAYQKNAELPLDTSMQSGKMILSSQQEMLAHMAFLTQPETHQYTAVSNSPTVVKGYLWVNKSSNEMLIMIDGLQPSDRRDYQAWLVGNDQQLNGGLLDWDYGQAHLYVQSKPMDAVKNISVSIEPKGGSRAPSGPEALNVSLAIESSNE